MTPEPAAQKVSAFPLATTAALWLLGLQLLVAVMITLVLLFTHGATAAASGLAGNLPGLVLYGVFAWFLPGGNRWLAVAFGMFCLFVLFSAIGGDENIAAAFAGYVQGVLAFVGMVGIYQGFATGGAK